MLIDSFGRKIDYLRISVTDRCNISCIYCRGYKFKSVNRKDILSYEEIIRVVKIFSELGIESVKITGGEPLLRKNLSSLIEKLTSLKKPLNISLTTNGLLLKRYAPDLLSAGLKNITISLDTLKKEKFNMITSGGEIDEVLKGIDLCRRLGFDLIKLNVVVMRGINDDEILDFLEFSLKNRVIVRFIELMPFLLDKSMFVNYEEIKNQCNEFDEFIPTHFRQAGPAEYYRGKNTDLIIGFISPISRKFCKRCNKLRLSSLGKLRLCLMNNLEYNIIDYLRDGTSDEEIKEIIKKIVEQKPKEYSIGASPCEMFVIGG